MFGHLGNTESNITEATGFTVTFADHDVDDFSAVDDYQAAATALNADGGNVNVSVEKFVDKVVFWPDKDVPTLQWSVEWGATGAADKFSPAQYDRVKAEGNLPDDYPDKKITTQLQNAAMRLRKLLGDDEYELFEAAEDPGNDMTTMDDDERKIFFLLKGEALLACSYGAPIWNLNNVGKGYVSEEGYADGRRVVKGENEIEQIAARFLERAMEFITPYIPEPDTDEDEEADDILSAGGMNFGAV